MRVVASDSRPSRRPITSRTPSGMPSSVIAPRYVHRPPSWKSAPDSLRWRITSPMKNGFPSVSRRMAWASVTSASSRSWRATAATSVSTAASSRPCSATRSTPLSRRRSASTAVSGCVRERSVSRYVPMTRRRIGSAERTRCFSSSSSGAPAQWRSSSTSTSGLSCDAAARRPVTASKRRNRSVSASATCGAGQIGNALRELGHETGELPVMRADVGREHGVGGVRDVVPQRLDERPVRQPDVLVAPAKEHRAALGMRRARRLGREPRLPDPRLAGEQHHLARAVFRLRPRERERFLLAAPAEHRKRRRRPEPRRQRDPDGRERLPRDDTRDDRLGQALQRDRPDRCERVPAPPTGQHAHDVGDEDLPTVGLRAESRRLDEGKAVGMLVLPRDVARADPDADGDRRRAVTLTIRPRSPAGSRPPPRPHRRHRGTTP